MLLFIITGIALVISCTEKNPFKENISSFQSFELSYTDGWTGIFSILADSGKIYFSSNVDDTFTSYGVLPDSIFKIIDTTVLFIHRNQAAGNVEKECADCQVLAMKIISAGDTIRLHQTGEISKALQPILHSLKAFIKNNRHRRLQTFIRFKTAYDIIPPPPPPCSDILRR